MKVSLVSPERNVFEGEATMVVVRTTDGDIAFEQDHIPFVGVLQPERVKIIGTDGTTRYAAVHSGFVEVAHNDVSILSDTVELAEEIDVGRAQAAKLRAEEALGAQSGRAQPGDGPAEQQTSEQEAALKRAEVRLEVAELAGSIPT